MKTPTLDIFIVEDDAFFANLLKQKLGRERSDRIHIYESGDEALKNLDKSPDLVILDYKLGEQNGLDVLRKLKSINPTIQVIFLSAQEKMSIAIKALKYGAYDYLEKSQEGLQRLTHTVHNVIAHNKLVQDNSRLKKQTKWFVSFLVLVELGILAYALS